MILHFQFTESTCVAGHPYFEAILISVQNFHLTIPHSVWDTECFLEGQKPVDCVWLIKKNKRQFYNCRIYIP